METTKPKPQVYTLIFGESRVEAIEIKERCVRSVSGAMTGQPPREFAFQHRNGTIVIATPSAPTENSRTIDGGGNWGFGYYYQGAVYDELKRQLDEAGFNVK